MTTIFRQRSGPVDRLMVAGMSAWFCLACAPLPACQREFVDVPKDHWAWSSVQELGKRGILVGYPEASHEISRKGARQAVTATYDLSTPNKAWHALMIAMAQGDEAAVKSVLAETCFADSSTHAIPFLSISKDLSVRKSVYLQRAKRWSKREFVIQRVDGSERDTVLATIIDPVNGPDAFDTWCEITMIKKDNKWRVTAMGY